MKCSETYPECKGCPDEGKDYCYGVKRSRKEELTKRKYNKRKKWDVVYEKMVNYFDEIKPIGNDGYRLIFLGYKKFNYYPTTGTLINMWNKSKINLSVHKFEKYFNFLKNGLE